MNKVLLDDAESKLTVINGIESLIDRPYVKTFDDVVEVITVYKATIQGQVDRLKGEQYQADANADHVTENQFNG